MHDSPQHHSSETLPGIENATTPPKLHGVDGVVITEDTHSRFCPPRHPRCAYHGHLHQHSSSYTVWQHMCSQKIAAMVTLFSLLRYDGAIRLADLFTVVGFSSKQAHLIATMQKV